MRGKNRDRTAAAGRFGTAVLAEVRKHEPVTSRGSDARTTFETKVQSLVGRRILAVDYWDVHNFSSEPARWDYGDLILSRNDARALASGFRRLARSATARISLRLGR